MSDRGPVICEPVRTAVGRYGGMLVDLPAATLARTVIAAPTGRARPDPARVDDVPFGQCHPNGEAPAVGRVAALDAGLPVTVPGLRIDRRCGPGLQAVIDAAMRVRTGACDLVIAGGAESMSRAECCSEEVRWGAGGDPGVPHGRPARGRVTAGGHRHPVPGGVPETAENLRCDHGIEREEQDEMAPCPHQRALTAARDGRFAEEVVPVVVPGRRGGPDVAIARGGHPRAAPALGRDADQVPADTPGLSSGEVGRLHDRGLASAP